jgi:hypothetical protein
MQIDYVKISCKEDVYICPTNFAKQMERNLHETTSQWKTYGKRLLFEDLEVRNVTHLKTRFQRGSFHFYFKKWFFWPPKL